VTVLGGLRQPALALRAEPQEGLVTTRFDQAQGFHLYLGDCLEVLPMLPPNSVDLVLADLPYGTTRCAWDSPIPLQPLWAEYFRVCRGAVVLFAQTPFDKVLGASNVRDLRYEWIWEKTNATGHLNAKRSPMKAHENVLVFYRKQPTYNPQMTHGHARKAAVKRGDGSEVYGKQNLDGLSYDSTSRYPRSVQTFASEKQTNNLHRTQKPEALLEYLIRTYSNPGDLVLDNCMGSGSTGAACLSTGRGFIGIEKDSVIFAVAQARLRPPHLRSSERSQAA
jgi:DNA modification methylase